MNIEKICSGFSHMIKQFGVFWNDWFQNSYHGYQYVCNQFFSLLVYPMFSKLAQSLYGNIVLTDWLTTVDKT